MNKITKKIWLQYILVPILCIIIAYLIYKQLFIDGDFYKEWALLKVAFRNANPLLIFLVLLLAPCNWSLEAKKWQILLSKIQPSSFLKSFAAVLNGMTISLITPNRVGDFAGRILHVDHNKKVKAALATMIGGIAQLTVTTVSGIIGLLYYNIAFPSVMAKSALIMALCIAITMLLLYFNVGKVAFLKAKHPFLRKIIIGLQIIKRYSRIDLLKILLCSLGRFAIYNIQFILLINILGAQVPFGIGYLMSSLMFWVFTVVPSVAMLELGVRGYTGLYLFVDTGLTNNGVAVLSGSYTLWLLNLVLPAIVGLIIMGSLSYRNGKIENK